MTVSSPITDTPPPAALAPDTFAERLYAMLAPLAQQDPQVGWSLLTYVNAIGTMFQLIEDLVRDTAEGDPGWSLLMDLNRCPTVALPWLGQFAGVRTLPNSSDADMRARIASTDGFKRGTLAALRGAAVATLTGRQVINIVERSGDKSVTPEYAYYLSVSTYTDETPNPAATLAALLSQKPGGLVLTFRSVTGQTYDQVRTDYATYTALKAAYTSYDAVRSDEPG